MIKNNRDQLRQLYSKDKKYVQSSAEQLFKVPSLKTLSSTQTMMLFTNNKKKRGSKIQKVNLYNTIQLKRVNRFDLFPHNSDFNQTAQSQKYKNVKVKQFSEHKHFFQQTSEQLLPTKKKKQINLNFQIDSQSIQPRNKEQQFISSLKPNDLFFCNDCFRYNFSIQKDYHYPVCRNKIKINSQSSQKLYQIGHRRLKLIVQLAQYTKTKQSIVEQLYRQIINQSMKKSYIVANQMLNPTKQSSNSDLQMENFQIKKYMSLEELPNALKYVYNILMKKYQEEHSTSISPIC